MNILINILFPSYILGYNLIYLVKATKNHIFLQNNRKLLGAVHELCDSFNIYSFLP